MILLLSFDVRRRGGIERLTLQVQASLQRQGQLVHLLTPQRCGPGQLGRQLGRLRFLWQLAWWLPRASAVLSMHALLLRPLGWLQPMRPRRQRLLCWLHGIEVWGEALVGVASNLQRCDALIASSRFSRDRVLEQPGPWPPAVVVHPMADLIDASAAPEPLPPGLTLLTVARMDAAERYKGHQLVLNALAQLRQRQQLPNDWCWRVVGDGDDRCNLEQQCRQLGLSSWVQFLGNLSDGALEQELRHCSLLLMPSAFAIAADGRASGEGFGIVYLEAAQAGRASIACRDGGQTDLIEHGRNGWLIAPRAEELAALLLELAQRPAQLSAAGHQALQRARSAFAQAHFDQALSTAITA